MGKKELIILAIFLVIILVSSLAVYLNNELTQSPASLAKPSLLENDFIVYKQDYHWLGLNGSNSVTRYIFWNITSINTTLANVQVLYYWINRTTNNFTFPETLTNIEVDVNTREILSSSNQSNELPFGSIFPYWISASVKQGDHVNTSFGQIKVNPAQTLQVFNSPYECWLLAFAVTKESNMEQGIYHYFYDTNTGICLGTQAHITLNGTSIDIEETVVKTNIKSYHS